MNHFYYGKVLIFISSFLIIAGCKPEFEPYFGLQTPGESSEIFAPGIVSMKDRYEFGISFSPELDEVFYSVAVLDKWAHIYGSRFEKGEWIRPDLINFTRNGRREEMEAFVSADGKKIFFTAYDSTDFRIWFVERSKKGHGKAQILDSPINSGDAVFYSNSAANGDLYYTNGTKNRIYYSPLIDGKYSDTIDTGIEYGGQAFISPDKEFILFDAFRGNERELGRDIHVCFRNQDGAWGTPVLLDSTVNTHYDETCPSLSPDGKYLFFSRYNDTGGKSDIYWISAKLIQNLREKESLF